MIGDIAYRFTMRPLSEDKGGGYLVDFPDLPGCIADGETVDEAITNARDASVLAPGDARCRPAHAEAKPRGGVAADAKVPGCARLRVVMA